MKKRLATLGLVLGLSVAGSITAFAEDAKVGTWASDEKGWWIQYSDGSYLKDSWYQDPNTGLYYYMGSDGYMLTDALVDGEGDTFYFINKDGVWVENYKVDDMLEVAYMEVLIEEVEQGVSTKEAAVNDMNEFLQMWVEEPATEDDRQRYINKIMNAQ